MSQKNLYSPDGKPRTFVAEDLDGMEPSPRNRAETSSSPGGEDDFRLISAVMAAIRSSRPKSRVLDNETLRGICVEAIRQGQVQDPRWIDDRINEIWSLQQHSPVKNPAPAPQMGMPQAFEAKPPVDARTGQSPAAETKKRVPSKRPASAAPPGSTSPAPTEFFAFMPAAPQRTDQDPADSPVASSDEDGQVPAESVHGSAPGGDSLPSGEEPAGQKAEAVNPLAGIVPTDAVEIQDQAHLLAVQERHQQWKASILNPKQTGSSGRANFKGLDLRHLSFAGLDFGYADFSDSLAEGVDFSDAQLTRANFTKARLNEADFCRSDLRKAVFQRAQLGSARLEGANTTEADFSWAQGSFAEARRQAGALTASDAPSDGASTPEMQQQSTETSENPLEAPGSAGQGDIQPNHGTLHGTDAF